MKYFIFIFSYIENKKLMQVMREIPSEQYLMSLMKKKEKSVFVFKGDEIVHFESRNLMHFFILWLCFAKNTGYGTKCELEIQWQWNMILYKLD